MVLRDLSFLAAVLILPAGLTAQSRNQTKSPAPPEVVKAEAPKVNPSASDLASGTGLAVDTKTFVIGPEDIIFVSVWREEALSGQYGVRPDGKITMNLIRDIQAAGLTPDKLGANITEALGEFLNKPEVVVKVLQINSRRYSLTGEVNRSGAYPLVLPITIFDALSGAGGFRDFANKKDVLVVRGDQRLHFDYEAYVKGKKTKGGKGSKGSKGKDDNFLIENGDTIIVK